MLEYTIYLNNFYIFNLINYILLNNFKNQLSMIKISKAIYELLNL